VLYQYVFISVQLGVKQT